MPHLVSLVVLSALSIAAAEPTRPNVVVVMPDDVGYGDFSVNGSPVVRTPNVDAFAREAVRFTDFHVSPTCAPTRAALMTGRHEFRSGVTHTLDERERLSLKATTLAQVLRSAGYTTGIFGKWHLGDEPAYRPERRGFDEVFVHGGGGIGQTYPGSCGDAPGNTYTDPAILHNGTFEKTKGYCTDVFFEQALKWIDAKRREPAPFFAYITPNAAHAPLQCPDDYARRHAHEVPADVAKFYGMVENIDDNFGRLTRALKAWGLDRDTLVVFLTDNGGTFGCTVFNAGMRGMKVTPYQGGTRVPSFWRWPAGFAGGHDVSALTAHVDVLPTLAEFAGATLRGAVKDQVEGRSLAPLLRDPRADWPDRTLVTHVGRWPRGQVKAAKYVNVSIRDARFTLVNNAEFFDLKADPGESKNVIADHPGEVARLRAAYDRWWADTLPKLDNEDAVGPKVNPFKARFWAQFGGGPDAALLEQMDPDRQKPASRRTPVDRPNVVFILADDLGVNDLSCYGRKDQPTPHLDALAAAGTRFTSAYAAQPLCSPTRAAILTGKSPARLKITTYLPGRGDAPSQRLLQAAIHQELPLEEVTLAELLKGAGYATGFVGKWHLGGPRFGPKMQGFDVAYEGRAVTQPSSDEGGKGEFDLTRHAEQFVTDHKDDPFFLYLCHNSPHIPLAAQSGRVAAARGAFNPLYAAVVGTLDDAVGRLLKRLDELKLTDKTLIVFTSDNGGLHVPELLDAPPTHNSPFRAGKGFVYEGGLRVPLIVRWPGYVPGGRTVSTPVVSTDWLPTFLDLCHVSGRPPGPLDGVSLAGLLRGGDLAPRPLFWHFPHYANQGSRPSGAVRDGHWKLVEQYEDGGAEVYDLARDPGETRDLAASQPDVVRDLRRKLADWRKSVGAEENRTNTDFDQILHKKLYEDIDVSRLRPAATAAAMRPALEGWRTLMDGVVRRAVR